MSIGTLQGITAGTILCLSLTAAAQPPPVSGVIRFYGQLVVGPCDLSHAQLAGVVAGQPTLRRTAQPSSVCRGVDNRSAVTASIVRLAAEVGRVVVVSYE